MRSPRQLLCTASLAAGLALSAFAQEGTVSPAVRVNVGGFNRNGANQIDGATVVSAGNGVFHAAWADQFGTTSSTQDIYFASSSDNGLTWSTPVRVDLGDAPNQTDSDQVHMVVTASGVIVVAWEEKRDGVANGASATEDLFYNRSTDGGLTWMATSLPLNSGTAGAHVTSDIDLAFLAVDGESIHATWEEDSVAGLGGAEEVWYTRSADAGETWTTPVIMNETPGVRDMDEPRVTAQGGLVLVYWVDDFGSASTSDDLYLARSTDGGVTFSTPVAIESDLSGNVDEPRAAIDGDLVIITYTENFTTDTAGEGVVATVSTDGGATWLPEVVLSPQMYQVANADADTPFVAVNGDNIYVVYEEDSQDRLAGGAGDSGGNVCYLARSNDRGATWAVDLDLEAGRISNRPRIVANDEIVVIYKEYNANGSNVPVFAWSVDQGVTWSPFTQVAGAGPDVDEGNAVSESYYLAIDPDSNTAVVVFMDNSVTGANEVYSSSVHVALSIGDPYCTAVYNSTGARGRLEALGNGRVAQGELTLVGSDLPLNVAGFALCSLVQDFVPNVQGSSGDLCLGGAIGRGVGGVIFNTGASGTTRVEADLTALPQPTGSVAALAGETWNFQLWHRDQIAQVATTSNLTNAVSVSFR
ncbi:MAG: sialidase family protein [Planctomycetota bacterium]